MNIENTYSHYSVYKYEIDCLEKMLNIMFRIPIRKFSDTFL